MRTRLVALIGALALLAAACAGAGATPDASDEGALASGIGVQGDWTIEVYDPDGSLDESVEFTNALTDQGAEFLGLFAIGFGRFGEVSIVLGDIGTLDTQGNSPCSTPYDDVLNPGDQVAFAPDTICWITTTQGEDDGDFTSLISEGYGFNGSVEVTKDGVVDFVEYVVFADYDLGQTDRNIPLTRKSGSAFGAPIDVSAGQIIQVSYEISFGTLP